MRVPEAEQHVRTQGPNEPSPNFSAPVRDAFGAQVNEAGAKLGANITALGNVLAAHVEKRMEWDAKQAGYEAGQEFDKTMQDAMYGDGTTTYDDPQTKEPVTITKALMGRRLNEALVNGGAVVDFDRQAASAQAKFLEPLKGNPVAYREALQRIDNSREAKRNSVIAHQAAQDTAAKIYTFKSAQETQLADMFNATDADVNERIHGKGGIVDTANTLEAYTGQPQEKRVGEAAENFAMARLAQTGSADAAINALGLVRDLPKQDYENILFKINNKAAAIQRAKEQAVEVSQNQTGSKFAQKVISFSTSPKELDNARALGATGDPNGLNEKDYHQLKELVNQKPYQAELRKRNALSYAVHDAFFAIQDKNVPTEQVSPKATFEQIANYRNAMLQAQNAGAFSKEAATSKLKKTEEYFDNAVKGYITQDHPNGQAIWKYTKDWLNNYYLNYKGPGEHGSMRVSKEEFEDAASYLGDKLMEVMDKGHIAPENIQPISRALIQDFLIQRHPELAGKAGLPNTIMDANASFRNIYDGAYDTKSDYKPDFKIPDGAAPKGLIEMHDKDGTVVYVHPTKIKQAKDRGLI